MTTATTTGAEQVTWDLNDLYSAPDDTRIAADEADLEAKVNAFYETYHGRVATLAPAELATLLTELEVIDTIESRLGAYASLRYSTDTADPARGAAMQRLRELAARLQTKLLFFELEWNELDDVRAKQIAQDPAVATWRHYLEASRRYKAHVLSEPEERILTEKSVTGFSAWARLFDELCSAIKPVVDGESIGFEQAMSMLQRADRGDRQKAHAAITEALEPGLRTRGFIFNTLLADKSISDRLRNYATWVQSRNLSNEASDESVEALVTAVTSRYDIPQRYYKLKARLLGLDTIADYDRSAPVSSSKATMPWTDARELVTGAYAEFDSGVGDIIDGFFTKSWIDAAEAPNKRTGAFCATTIPSVHPYVFMTYTGERRSVLTLAHELGHGLHGVLSGVQTPLNVGTPLTTAETASVFGESLTFRRLLDAEQDPAERLDLLVGRLDDTIATVFRQIAMNRFEDAVHTHRRERGELSVDDFSEHWASTQRELFGDSVDMTDGYRTWWSYIPHFIRTPGYVYAYAFGYLFSLAIFTKYVREGDGVVGPYKQLLSAGGSDAPDQLAKLVGLDLTDPGFWASGLASVDEILAEAEALAATHG